MFKKAFEAISVCRCFQKVGFLHIRRKRANKQEFIVQFQNTKNWAKCNVCMHVLVICMHHFLHQACDIICCVCSGSLSHPGSSSSRITTAQIPEQSLCRCLVSQHPSSLSLSPPHTRYLPLLHLYLLPRLLTQCFPGISNIAVSFPRCQ